MTSSSATTAAAGAALLFSKYATMKIYLRAATFDTTAFLRSAFSILIPKNVKFSLARNVISDISLKIYWKLFMTKESYMK